MNQTSQGSNSKTVNKEFEFRGKLFWYVAEVEFDWYETMATYHDPAEGGREVTDIRIDEVQVKEGHEEVELDVYELPKELVDAIEEDASLQVDVD